MFEKTNTKSYFDEFYSPTINDSPKSIGLMLSIRLLFNNPLSHATIKFPRIKMFKTGFSKLAILPKFSEWNILSSCLRHYNALPTKIDMWLAA